MIYNKHGQFFFVATLIIITIIFSLTNVYNTIYFYKEDSTYKFVAQNLKFEALQIINNGYYNNDSFEKINSNIINFTRYYSSNYPGYNITIITGVYESPQTFKQVSFRRGSIYANEYVLTLSGNQINLDLNSLEFKFNLTKGFNFNTIVIEENENGKFISSK